MSGNGDDKHKENVFAFKLFLVFFKVGAFTIGGGHVMIPFIRREIVEQNKWMKDEDFINDLSLAQAFPGPIVVNFAITGGYSLLGFPGIFAAVLGGVLPSFLIILAIAAFFSHFQDAAIIQAAFAGIRPAVAALITAALVKIGFPILSRDKKILILFLLLLGLGIIFKLHPALIVLLGATLVFALPEVK